MDEAPADLPDDRDLVLVAVVPSPRDLEIARLLGWYRIPLRHAPRILAVDFLAFYQPSSFGASGGLIEYIAPVKGYEMTTRRELLRDEDNHPRAAEDYLKMQLGGITKLPNPIRAAQWKRLAFLYTTGAYLLTARSLSDLVLESADRRIVWHSIRERALQNRGYCTGAIPGPDLPASLLTEILGIIQPR